MFFPLPLPPASLSLSPHPLSPSRISFPPTNLHGAILNEVLVHVKGIEQQMRLVAHSLPQALKLGLIEVLLQDGAIVRVRALLDDFAGAFTWTHATDVGEPLDVSQKISPFTYFRTPTSPKKGKIIIERG